MERETQEVSLEGDVHLGCPPQRSFKENKSCDIGEGGCLVRKGISAAYLGHHEEEEIGQHSPREGCHMKGGTFSSNLSNGEYNHMDRNMSRHRNGQMVVANLERGNCPGCANLCSGSDQGELPARCEKEVNGEGNNSRSNHTCEQPQWSRTNRKREIQQGSRNGLLGHEENCPHFVTLENFLLLGEEGANQGDGHSSTSWNGTDYTNVEDSDAEVDCCGGEEEDGVARGVNLGSTLENISPSNNQAVHTIETGLERYGCRKKKQKNSNSNSNSGRKNCRYEEASERESDQVLHNMANQKLTGTSVMLTGEKSKYIYKLVPFFKNGEAKFYMNTFAAYYQLQGQFSKAPGGIDKRGEGNRRGEGDRGDRLGELHTSMRSAMAYFYLMNEKAMSATRKRSHRSSPFKGTPQGGQVDDVMERPPNCAAPSISTPPVSICTYGAHFTKDCVGESPEEERPHCDNPQQGKPNSTLKWPRRRGEGCTPEKEDDDDDTNGGIHSSHYAVHISEEEKLVKLLGEHKHPAEEGQKKNSPNGDSPACVGSDIMSCRRLQQRSEDDVGSFSGCTMIESSSANCIFSASDGVAQQGGMRRGLAGRERGKEGEVLEEAYKGDESEAQTGDQLYRGSTPTIGGSDHYTKNRNSSALGEHRVLAFLVRQKLIPKCYNIVPVYRCEGEEAASYLAETHKMNNGNQSAGSTADYVPEVRRTKPHEEEPPLNGRRDDIAVRRDMPGKAEKWRVGKLSDLVKAAEGTPSGDPSECTVHLALKLKKICHSIDPRNQNMLDLKLGYNTLKDNDTQFSERLKEESDSIEWSEKEKYVKRWSRMKKDIRSEHLNTSDEHIIDLSARDINLPPSFFKYDNHEIYCLLKSWKQEITARMTTQRRLGFRICALVCGMEQQDVLTDQGVREFYADCVAKYGSVADGGAGCCAGCGSEDYQHSRLCHSLPCTPLSQHNHLQRDAEKTPPSIDHCYEPVQKKLQISRDVGLHLREEHVVYSLTNFFKSIVSIVLPKLISLKRWLEEQHVYSFCSTSLLIIYDRRNPETCDIKWIDFTYSFDNTVSPSRYEQMKHERLNLDILFGVNNLIKLCRTVFFDSKVPPSLSCPSSSERKGSHPGIHDQP